MAPWSRYAKQPKTPCAVCMRTSFVGLIDVLRYGGAYMPYRPEALQHLTFLPRSALPCDVNCRGEPRLYPASKSESLHLFSNRHIARMIIQPLKESISWDDHAPGYELQLREAFFCGELVCAGTGYAEQVYQIHDRHEHRKLVFAFDD